MPERKTLNRTYSVGDQVPTCPIFTRVKIKSRFGIIDNFASHNLINNDIGLLIIRLVLKILNFLGFAGGPDILKKTLIIITVPPKPELRLVKEL